ncbi:hypothetical protein BDR22DRAFT_886402 [Usnea florida]
MLPPLAGQLLCFLATTSLLALRASADSADWLFPAYIPNAPPITFQSQDTIDAAWTSAFVAPVLVLFCLNNDGSFSIDFRSPAPVLPNGSYAIPLDSVQKANQQRCHLNLNETNGPLMGTDNSSNSGAFLVDDQYVLFRPSPTLGQQNNQKRLTNRSMLIRRTQHRSDRSATTWSTSTATTSTASSPSTPPTTTSASTPSSKSRHPNAAAATTTPTTTTGPSPTPNAPPNTGLSTGAKAGIGVGVTLGVLALLAAALFLWLRARKKKQPRNDRALASASEFESVPKKPEYGGDVFASEMAGHQPLSEMDGGSGRQEEKDGFPVARREEAGELEADPAR